MGTAIKMTVEHLRKAIESNSAAFRLTLKLEAVSPKVFPPTYEGGKYAIEERMIGGTKIPCVLLDSTPSQANRMELALQDALDGGSGGSALLRSASCSPSWAAVMPSRLRALRSAPLSIKK